MISRTASDFVGWCVAFAAVTACLSVSGATEAVSGEPGSSPTLTVFCWPGYLPDAVTDAFTRKTGIDVVKEYYATNEEFLRHRLDERRYDLIQPSDYAAEELIERGVLEKLRRKRIFRLDNIAAAYCGLQHDPQGEYTVPWLAGTVGIVINTKRVSEEVTSYKDVFSGKYRGRIVAFNDPREWLGMALLNLGFSVNRADEKTLREVGQVWRRWMPQVAVFDSDTADRVMLSGGADIALTWSGDAALLLSASPDFKFVIPAEGAHRYVDCLAIPRGAPNRDAAERFINFVLRPEIGVMISRDLPFTNPNREAFKKLSTAEKMNPASYPRGGPELHSFHSIGDRFEHVEKLYYESRFRPTSAGPSFIGVPDHR